MNYTNLLKAVTHLGSPKVLLVGDFMLDSYIYGDTLRISPEAPVPVVKVNRKEYNCGGAGSVAVDLCELGAQPFCVGVIGNDSNGKLLSQMLQQAGAKTEGLIQTDYRPTMTKTRMIGLAQHKNPQQLLRIDEECTDGMSKNMHRQLYEIFESFLNECDIVCLQDHNKGILSEAFCQLLIGLAKKVGKKVIIDPSLIKDYSKYKNANLITPNRWEAGRACGIEIVSPDQVENAAQILCEKYSIENAVITLDKEGLFLRHKDTGQLLPTPIPRTVCDGTGAGDILLSMFAITIAAGCDYVTAASLANIAGGIEVEKFGVATVSIDEIVNDLIQTRYNKTGKIQYVDELIKHLDYHRQQKDTIVFTNGCFDVLHRGHIEYLKFCKERGNIVVLGLNSDSSVRQLKGPERPVNNQHDRAAVLAAMESIDYITIFDELDPLDLIQQVRPDVLVKGADWADKGVVGKEFVESYGGRVELAPLVDGKSSTSTIEKLKRSE